MARIAFYSHDTLGLGHLRRCLKLTQAFSRSIDHAEGILVTGSAWWNLFSCPSSFRIVPLPPIVKRGRSYRPLVASIDLDALIEFRSRNLEQLAVDYRPDLLVVDNVPLGLMGEMKKALEAVHRMRSSRIVLVLRDVLDSYASVHSEWLRVGAEDALQRIYDQVWILGDAEDARAISGLPGMCHADVRVCGRIGLSERQILRDAAGDRQRDRRCETRRPRLLVTAGGGRDAVLLIRTFVEMIRCRRPRFESRIVLGPDFPREHLWEVSDATSLGVRVDRFVQNLPAIMAEADLVLSMAGYNTTCEIESLGKRCVMVPRVWPRQEQWIRARRQERMGRAQVVLPSDLSPERLWRAVRRALGRPAPSPRRHEGELRAAALAAELMARPTTTKLGEAVAM